MKTKSKVQSIVLMTVGGIVFFAVFILVFGYITQLLWNALMPDIFSLPSISFLQACGLLFLAKLFFGFGTGNFNNKSNKKTPSQNERYKQEFSQWLAEKENLAKAEEHNSNNS